MKTQKQKVHQKSFLPSLDRQISIMEKWFSIGKYNNSYVVSF